MYPLALERDRGLNGEFRATLVGRRVQDGATMLTDCVKVQTRPDAVVIDSVQTFGPERRWSQQVRWELDASWLPRNILVTFQDGALAEFTYWDDSVEICFSARGQVRRTRERLRTRQTMCLIQNTLHWPLILAKWMTDTAGDFATLPDGTLAVTAPEPAASGDAGTRRRVGLTVKNGPRDLLVMQFTPSGMLERFVAEGTSLAAELTVTNADD